MRGFSGLAIILLTFFTVQSLIPSEMRPSIKHTAHLSRQGCSDGSDAFANFSYTVLTNASALPDGLSFDDFSPCDYLPNLQQVLFSTDVLNESVTYEHFVIIPDSLNTSLHEHYGGEVEINGPFVRFSSNLTTLTFRYELTYVVFHTAIGEFWTLVSPSFHRVF